MEAIVETCYKNNISKIGVTPWRSLLIKGIKEEDWIKRIKLLGKYGINIRHSSLELNWRIPDFDKFAIELKQYLVSEFDRMDIRTYGLTFAIRTKKVDLDAIVVIEKVPAKSMFSGKQMTGNFNIYHTKNFEINQKEFITYAENVSYSSLPRMLQKLTNFYYEQQNLPEVDTAKNKQKEKKSYLIYQCKHCFTTYDQDYGDTVNHIAAGTTFEKLPATYRCPVCDSPKTDFEALQIEQEVA